MTFNNIEEAQAFLKSRINASLPLKPADAGVPSNQGAAAPQLAPPPAPAIVPPAAQEGVAVAPKKPGRPKKVDAAPEQPAAGGTPTLTEADVRAALMKVNDKFGTDGLAKVSEVIKPFGVARIGELKPEVYTQVIEAATKAIA